MAKDDMRIIIYKILRYLYGRVKRGERPKLEDMCCHGALLDIPEGYWERVMVELIEGGLVRGFAHFETKDGTVIAMGDDAAITLAGVEFLEGNGGMAKARQALGRAFEAALDALLRV